MGGGLNPPNPPSRYATECSNRRRNLVPEELGQTLAQHTHQKSAPENGVNLWRRFLDCVSGPYNPHTWTFQHI